MKKILWIILLIAFGINISFWTINKNELISANNLAERWIINDNYTSPKKYNLDKTISRREMLKIMMKLSDIEIWDSCEWRFSDLNEKDWWCKYAELALKYDFITNNTNFNPDDKVSKIEVLKMLFKPTGLEREKNSDWKQWYVNSASYIWLTEQFSDYNTKATRWWIFNIAYIILETENVIEFNKKANSIQSWEINDIIDNILDDVF